MSHFPWLTILSQKTGPVGCLGSGKKPVFRFCVVFRFPVNYCIPTLTLLSSSNHDTRSLSSILMLFPWALPGGQPLGPVPAHARAEVLDSPPPALLDLAGDPLCTALTSTLRPLPFGLLPGGMAAGHTNADPGPNAAKHHDAERFAYSVPHQEMVGLPCAVHHDGDAEIYDTNDKVYQLQSVSEWYEDEEYTDLAEDSDGVYSLLPSASFDYDSDGAVQTRACGSWKEGLECIRQDQAAEDRLRTPRLWWRSDYLLSAEGGELLDEEKAPQPTYAVGWGWKLTPRSKRARLESHSGKDQDGDHLQGGDKNGGIRL
ncbi:hypothetical protein B0H17DRAFT_1135917 [Mycena rosella]|uniref:Uncharacterized protein n=1 Tax=Mycena rosella TaxID=1033263 RepID=A0AAD7DBP5_MYCRO|nr:hypothetical protein B0H17DRAFT_1135917 [Mycena rosella]